MDISTDGIIAIGKNGIETVNRESIKQYLVEKFKAVYGENVEIGLGTEDDNMLEMLADLFNDMGVVAVTTANGYSLSSATGFQLDNIANIYYGNIRRGEGTKSTISVTLTGTAGATILGGQLKDSFGGLWDLPTFTFDSNGTFTATATHNVVGAYSIAPNQISGTSAIATPNPNWTGVTAVSGSLFVGENEETDTQLRTRLAEEQYLTAQTTTSSLRASLLSLQETVGDEVQNLVTKATILENDTNAPITIGDMANIPAHSIAVMVKARDGVSATYQKIANTIYANKGQGVGTYAPTGATKVSKEVNPYGDVEDIRISPSNVTVNFVSAVQKEVDVDVAVTYNPSSILTVTASEIADVIRQAIVEKMSEYQIMGTMLGIDFVKGISDALQEEYKGDIILYSAPKLDDDIILDLSYDEYAVLGTLTVDIS